MRKGYYHIFGIILALIILFSLAGITGVSAQTAQIPLPGRAIPQFIDPLPLLTVAGGPIETIIDDGSQIELTMKQFKAQVMPSAFVPATGTYTGTWVWGYRNNAPSDPAGTYIGPVIVAERGSPTEIKFINNLPTSASDNEVLAYKNSTDQSLHWANPGGVARYVNNGTNEAPIWVGNPDHYQGAIPAVPHLHGGEQPAAIDGGPDQWFTSTGQHGPAFYSMDGDSSQNYTIFRYPNVQEAAPLWFHDHTLGATRLNVYAGLAGAYVLTDPAQTLPGGLTPIGLDRDGGNALGDTDSSDEYLIPLVIQDRMFDTNGQLYFPNVGINPEHPYWLPEFLGDTICVNGKVWPFLNVEPQRYRFLVLNGSNARPYEMFLTDPVTKAPGPPIWVIGTDGGYLDNPVKIDPALGQKLLVMPGERYEVIVDFAGYAGRTFLLRNTASAPYPKGAPPNGSTTGRIMQFRVGPGPITTDNSYNPASGTPIRTGSQAIVRLANPATGGLGAGVLDPKTRELTLNEVMGPGGPLEVLVNNTKWMGLRPGPTNPNNMDGVVNGGKKDGQDNPNYLTEWPNEGDTEVWEIVNLTADAHPIHLHLVQFQLMNRQNFNVNKYTKAYNGSFPGGVFIGAYGPPLAYDPGSNTLSGGKYGGNPDIAPYLQGPVRPPSPEEAGWKDTVIMYPGQVTRIVVRWGPQGLPANTEASGVYFPFVPNDTTTGTPSKFDYVWHCHIIDHEDNEMMRPDQVVPNPSAERTYDIGSDY